MFKFLGKGGEKLTLQDYDKIRNRFCFLDESGSLVDRKDPFFTVGFLKCSQPYYIANKIIYERQKRNFHDEMKFNKLSIKNIGFALFALDAFFSTQSLSFCSYSLYKEGEYFNKTFEGDPWRAYEEISIRLLESNINPENEIVIVIADYVSTPDYVRFEVNVKRKINDKFKRLAVAGVCRIDSRANDLLQLTDLMIGAINYDLKLSTGVIINGSKYKKRFLEHFKSNLGVTNFIDKGFKNYNCNIFIDKDARQRLPLPYPENSKEKEKELST